MKLDVYGIRGIVLKWVESYLKSRKQCVKIEQELSEYLETKFGVPQGSVLGPILFLLYVNDLAEYIKERTNGECNVILYADDSNLIITAKTWDQLEIISNSILEDVIQFLRNLNLICNVNKTNHMCIQLRKKNEDNVSIMYGGNRVEEVQHCKFLGMLLDDHLTGEAQAEYTSGKLKCGLYMMKQLSQIVSKQVLIKVYYSFIFSHLNYGCIVWGGASEQKIMKLFSLQKSAVRIIKKKSRMESCRGLFRELQMLTTPSIYIFNCVKLALDKHNGEKIEVKCRYQLRNPYDLSLESYTGKFADKNPFYSGVRFYNRLPNELKRIPKSQRNVMKIIKNYLIEKEYYSVKEFLDGEKDSYVIWNCKVMYFKYGNCVIELNF